MLNGRTTMLFLNEAPAKAEGMQSRNWETTEGDRAYLSHHHTIEVIEKLALFWGFIETHPFHSVNHQEYRNTFIAMDGGREFSITTIVYVDSSTYTCIHPETEGPVLQFGLQDQVFRLSNADIKRVEGRDRRQAEIEHALQALGFIPKPAEEEKKVQDSGIVAKKGDDGIYVLDYSGIRNVKIELAERVLDYRKFNKVTPDDQEPGKDG